MQYKFEQLNTLAGIFCTIEDPRDNRGKLHKLLDIFILTIFGLLWGHTDFTNMAKDLKYHEKYFSEMLFPRMCRAKQFLLLSTAVCSLLQ